MYKYRSIYLLFFICTAVSTTRAETGNTPSDIPQSLQEQLDAFAAESQSRITPESAEIMRQAAEEISGKNIPQTCLQKGDTVPFFELPNAKGELFSIQEKLKDGPVVITFYRGGWCPYCNLSLRALQQSLPRIKELGATLVAISPEQPDDTLDTATKNTLEFEVLSDKGNTVAGSFGITFTLPEKLKNTYKDFGIDLETVNGDTLNTLPVPATFIVDSEGTIVYTFVNTDYSKRAEPAEIITVLELLQE
ncbi:MAG: AhpC/TSA family protein [bacterium]|nr:AhpC/TSA family protein [bacterium]